jgi:hypothetical protein
MTTEIATKTNLTLYKKQIDKAKKCSIELHGSENISKFVRHLIDNYEPKKEKK